MTLIERKAIARRLLEDVSDSFFHELDYEELQDFYGTGCHCEVIPATAHCAREEARRILGESTASKIMLRALGRARRWR